MAYSAFTDDSKGPDSTYDSTSWDSGAYLLSDNDEWFSSPNIVPGQEQSHGLSLSSVDPKSQEVVLGITSGGKKHAYNSALGPVSAVGVLFTYKHGASGLFGHAGGAVAGTSKGGLSSRTVTLSCVHPPNGAHAANNEDELTPSSTVIATTISSAFSAAVIYSDYTTVNYNVTAYDAVATTGARQHRPPRNQTIAPYSTIDRDGGSDDSVGPNIRRLVNSGYL